MESQQQTKEVQKTEVSTSMDDSVTVPKEKESSVKDNSGTSNDSSVKESDEFLAVSKEEVTLKDGEILVKNVEGMTSHVILDSDKSAPEETTLATEEGEVSDEAPQSSRDGNLVKSDSVFIAQHDESCEDHLQKNPFESHPYKQLLINFQPTIEQMSPVSTITFPKTIQQTPCWEVSSRKDLEKVVNELKQEKEIGVDVEYSDHGYKALTCLVQLSTPSKDYIVDAKCLKDDMSLLSEILCDSKVVKIFHAATNDLKWLQQDFDLFVINMFDTQKAMKALGYKKLGLDALLQDYNITKDKSLQRADFRIRPLPPLFKDYARTDSHYLITIYHKLKNELIQSNLLRQVLTDCNKACMIVYHKVEDETYSSIVRDVKESHKRQLSVLEKLNQWRREKAEYIDKNPGVILSKNNMATLVSLMPTDKGSILKITNSEYVRRHIDEVVNIMLQGKQENDFKMKRNPQFQHTPNAPRFNKNKRKLNQTDFGHETFVNDKRQNYFNRNNPKRDFDLRNTLKGDTFKQKRNKRFR